MEGHEDTLKFFLFNDCQPKTIGFRAISYKSHKNCYSSEKKIY